MTQNYVFEAHKLLSECVDCVEDLRDESCRSLVHLSLALGRTRDYLHQYALYCVENEIQIMIQRNQSEEGEIRASLPSTETLNAAVQVLRTILSQADHHQPQSRSLKSRIRQRHAIYSVKDSNTADMLLFRLVVHLQLALVRIDDARFVLKGRYRRSTPSQTTRVLPYVLTLSFLGASSYLTRSKSGVVTRSSGNSLQGNLLRAGALLVSAVSLQYLFRKEWISRKLQETRETLDDWNQQWKSFERSVLRVDDNDPRPHQTSSPTSSPTNSKPVFSGGKSNRLMEFTIRSKPHTTSTWWPSQGELRYFFLKRTMEVFYASVGAANEINGPDTDVDESTWQMTLTTAAASLFYSMMGASSKAAELTSSSSSARQLIQNAWGMVSLPSIKNLSLSASKLLKGAAVADRVEIAGVPCFVLSKDPVPELAAAIKRFRTRHGRPSVQVHRLSTIDEDAVAGASPPQARCKPFASDSGVHRRRDVIFHLTGGGFFAHIIASDLLYLLDWSGHAEAVVICPEYSLLPDYRFPTALIEVESVYHTLLSDENLGTLGFETGRIVVTGESTGGNLAAALCVKLCLNGDGVSSFDGVDPAAYDNQEDDWYNMDDRATETCTRQPDALMLSSPVLSFSLASSSREGSIRSSSEDPVLPSGLITAISDSYVEPSMRKHPLVSPLCASDNILSEFPPTLCISSSTDPLLDDSVIFKKRLCDNGVSSELWAAPNLPHAYLGLGTAGFPEAVDIQERCQSWLLDQLTRNR